MTEERFWDLAEEGARFIVIGMQWLLIWPLILLGLAASRIESDETRNAAQPVGREHDPATQGGRP